MSNLIESYEHQYSGLTAEITSNIGRIPNLTTDAKQNTVSTVERLTEEAKELLEQMELEVRSLPAESRPKFHNRLKSYQKELNNLEREFKRSKTAFSDKVIRDELLNGEDCTQFQSQRARLLDNTDALDRMGRSVDRSYEVCIETEQIGGQILGDLHSQREQLNKTRDRLKETDAVLGKSSRVLSGMMKRIVQNRIILVGLVLIMVTVIVVGVYYAVKKHKDSKPV